MPSKIVRKKQEKAFILLRKGQIQKAIEILVALYAENPSDPECAKQAGIALAEVGRIAEASQYFGKAVSLQPDNIEHRLLHARSLIYQGKLLESVHAYQHILQLDPSCYEAHISYAKLLISGNQQSTGIQVLHHALTLPQADDEPYSLMGTALHELGQLEESRKAYSEAIKINRNNIRSSLGLYLSLPIIYTSIKELKRERARYISGISELESRIESFKSLNESQLLDQLQLGNFYLAYQGYNDRNINTRFGNFVCNLMTSALPKLSKPIQRTSGGDRRRKIGFVCHYFHSHTVSYYFSSWPKLLHGGDYEIIAYHLDPHPDAVSEEVARSCDQYVRLNGSTSQIASKIKRDKIDILIYPEIGMYPKHLQLGALRLAPIQCVAWGHPVTTGLPTIDYFISSDATEPPEGQDHYTENLIRLPSMGVYCNKTEVCGTKDRAQLGLPTNRHLYLCAQSLFKIHPDFDDLVGKLINGDPDALILFFASKQAMVTGRFQQRLRATLGDAGIDFDKHIQILDHTDHNTFLSINAAANLVIDTPYWSGGRSSFDALSAGTPIVTLEGKMSRGRQTMGMLSALQLQELVTDSTEAYIEKAFEIASNADYRNQLSSIISSRTSGTLFENPDIQAGLIQALETMD